PGGCAARAGAPLRAGRGRALAGGAVPWRRAAAGGGVRLVPSVLLRLQAPRGLGFAVSVAALRGISRSRGAARALAHWALDAAAADGAVARALRAARARAL